MAKLDKKTIAQLTRLCRIDCTEEEQEKLLDDLKKILDYFEELEEINTDDIPPCHHPVEMTENTMREDKVGTMLDRESFLANAPAHIGGMIRVPPVIKQN